MENQYFNSKMPSRVSIRSNWGQVSKNWFTCLSVAKPITFSTPARLYQLLSKITISPALGKCFHIPLEVPLTFLLIRGRPQGYDPATPGVHRLGEPLDRAAFPRRITAFKQHDHAKAVAFTQYCIFTSSACNFSSSFS